MGKKITYLNNTFYTLRIVIIIAGCSFLYSCFLEEKQNTFVICKQDGSTIIVDVDTFLIYKYWLNVGSVLVDSGIIEGHKEFLLPKVVKGNKQNRKEIAFNAAKNNYTHEIRLQINDIKDTTFTFQQSISKIPDDKISFTGFGAPLARKAKEENMESELRIWMYRRQEKFNDSLFEAFRLIYSELSLSGDNEYIPVGNIPVVHDIDGCKYKINSDIKADYYAVVACSNQAYINQYVESLVGNNFTGASKSLSNPLTCHYKKGTSGYKNVFLLCINKDWTYSQIPIATFALDNWAPALMHNGFDGIYHRIKHNYTNNILSWSEEPACLRYNNRIKVIYPKNRPKIFGRAYVTVTNWDGNSLECNLTFRVEFSGDSKSATIQRRGELCYPEKYFGNYFKPEDKVIYAKNHKGPYTFTYKMHFNDGDNIIPIVVEDYHGNKHKGSITIKAKFVSRNEPSINIYNNIDI